MTSGRLILAIITLAVLAAVSIALLHHSSAAPAASGQQSDGAIRYLPLGDSYTIGQSVAAADRWPNQLVQRLDGKGFKLDIIANPSVTGYTTQDLIDRELPLMPRLRPDFVTVLIGVNDYVQGYPASVFERNLSLILDTLQKPPTKPPRILLVTIPDFGKTPTGAQFGPPASSAAGIKAFNAIITQQAAARQLAVADIFPVSQKVVGDSSLVAADGLHPSGKQYAGWTDVILATLLSHKVLP